MTGGEVILQIRDVSQDYGGLRPLRIRAFDLRAGQRVAILGIDKAGAETFVNLMTGASAPSTGHVRAFGQLTTAIADSDTWLRALQQYGLFGPRTVLVEQLTVEQNLAIPITLDVDPLHPDLRPRVARLAAEVGLAPATLAQPPTALTPLDLHRLRLGRALALAPRLLLVEHASAALERADAEQLATEMARIVAARGMAAVYITADRGFAERAAAEIVTLKPATGELVSAVGWRRWFGGT